ncbi:hypothetical protein [Bradyrhizobium genosp. P]|uniref:hypothetical protein n=1 Tax=Bradyrhizobium genosp. P TaxID=83641 RepID=UPI003CE6B7F5
MTDGAAGMSASVSALAFRIAEPGCLSAQRRKPTDATAATFLIQFELLVAPIRGGR